MDLELVRDIKEMSFAVRKRIVELTHKAGKNGAHAGGSLSAVDMMAVLYKAVMHRDEQRFDERDRFIMSKGHAALALYCTLESMGILTKEETDTFEENGSSFMAHSICQPEKGLEFSGGSLSLGISYAVGVALGCRSKGYNSHVYVLLGDGECDEGLVWEALMCAANYHLDNFTIILDHNHLQADGSVEEVMDINSMSEKFKAFGYHTIEVDGHSVEELLEAFQQRVEGQPTAIVAATVKGKGVSFMEGKKMWHHGTLSDSQYERALNDITRRYEDAK